MAFMYLPMFTVAHLLAEPLGYAADGFSLPYRFAIQVGSLLFAFVALWYFRKLYLKFFSDRTVAIVLLLLVFGTNYLNYSAIDAPLTHNWLFGGYVFLLLNTISFYNAPSFKYAIRIGLLCGIMILIRPSEMISVLIPLLWGLERISVRAIKNKFALLYEHRSKLAVAIACTMLVGSIQIAYWLYVTGQPLVYSYQHIGFSWLKPFTYEYMFSARNGWFAYSPVLILIFLGIPLFVMRGKNKVAVLFFLLLNLYIVTSWEVWWYGGRAMMQSYPVILFPFAQIISYIYNKKWLAWIASPFIIVLAYVNIWWTYNAHTANGIFEGDAMTRAYYRRVLFRYKVPDDVFKLKDTKEIFEGTPKQMTRLYFNDFENDTLFQQATDQPLLGSRSIFVDENIERTPSYIVAVPAGHEWLRIAATFKCGYEWEAWRIPQFVVMMEKAGAEVKIAMLRVSRYLKPEEPGRVYLDMKMPDAPVDNLQILLLNVESKSRVTMDNLEVWGFKE